MVYFFLILARNFSMRRQRSYSTILLFGYAVLIIGCWLSSCENYPRNKTHAGIPESRIKQGEAFAKKFCQSCHLFPDPAMLDVTSWEDGVLPNMGPRLGIYNHNFKRYPSAVNDTNLPKGFYPSESVIQPEDWQNIIDYYVSTSPDSLVLPVTNKINNNLTGFKPQVPLFTYADPAISFIKIDISSPRPQLVLSDIRKQQIFRFNDSLHLIDSMNSFGSIVDMVFSKNKIIACDVGLINPTNAKFGRGFFFSKDSLQHLVADSVAAFQKLARPVQITAADLNLDGQEDYVVCEFGHFTGSLSWMENNGANKFSRHELLAQPGAIRSEVYDYDKDGLPDIWTLFTQGKEGIVVFKNKGNNQFEQREVLSFPAVYGSTYFELCDFNNDGYKDILYSCGDNADYSMVLKPYHGVYIFLNDGKNQFSEQFFFHINGCFKAIPRDFDNDGDLDIATISFFADYARTPREGFVYLENKGDFKFEPSSFSQSVSGRWLTMDVGDLNADGNPDIVLGNFSIRPSNIPSKVDWKKGPPFIVLINNSPPR